MISETSGIHESATPRGTLMWRAVPLEQANRDFDLWIEPSMKNAMRLRESLVKFGGWVEGMTLEHFTTERTMFQIGLSPCRVRADTLGNIEPQMDADSRR